jgi:hypothetical protein
MDQRLKQFDAPHVPPLMRLIQEMHALRLRIPNLVDPSDRGIYARLLFLMKRPGLKAAISNLGGQPLAGEHVHHHQSRGGPVTLIVAR